LCVNESPECYVRIGHNLTTPLGTMTALYPIASDLATKAQFLLIMKVARLSCLGLEILERKIPSCSKYILLTDSPHHFTYILTVHPIDDGAPTLPAADVHDHLKSPVSVQVHSFCKSIGVGIGHLELRII